MLVTTSFLHPIKLLIIPVLFSRQHSAHCLLRLALAGLPLLGISSTLTPMSVRASHMVDVVEMPTISDWRSSACVTVFQRWMKWRRSRSLGIWEYWDCSDEACAAEVLKNYCVLIKRTFKPWMFVSRNHQKAWISHLMSHPWWCHLQKMQLQGLETMLQIQNWGCVFCTSSAL